MKVANLFVPSISGAFANDRNKEGCNKKGCAPSCLPLTFQRKPFEKKRTKRFLVKIPVFAFIYTGLKQKKCIVQKNIPLFEYTFERKSNDDQISHEIP